MKTHVIVRRLAQLEQLNRARGMSEATAGFWESMAETAPEAAAARYTEYAKAARQRGIEYDSMVAALTRELVGMVAS